MVATNGDSRATITMDSVGGNLTIHVRGYGITKKLADTVVRQIIKLADQDGIPTEIVEKRADE
jgi:hypothetical protein